MPPLLEPLAPHRDHFTIFSGLDHRAPNGHEAWNNYLCGKVPGSYSLDQIIADRIGQQSRFPSIHLIAGASEHTNGRQMSYTKEGVPLPEIERPSVLYKRLFMSQADRARVAYVLSSGKSVLDDVVADAKRLHASLPASDQAKLGEYFESVRTVERRMSRQIETIDEPIPQPNYKLPETDPITPNLMMEAEEVLYDLMALAIQTESTRVITLFSRPQWPPPRHCPRIPRKPFATNASPATPPPAKKVGLTSSAAPLTGPLRQIVR